MRGPAITRSELGDMVWVAEGISSLHYRRSTLLDVVALARESPNLTPGARRLLQAFGATLDAAEGDDELEVNAAYLKQFAYLALRTLEARASTLR